MLQLSSEDTGAIQHLFQEYGEAWMRRDAKACAALFAPEGELLALDGELCATLADIAAYYTRQLTGPYRDFTVTDFNVATPRAVHTDVAVMNATWRLHGFVSATGAGMPVSVRATFVMRRSGGQWRYVVARFMVPFVAPVAAA
jgi:uncharacterized protein (TIGR02246 family)